MALCSLCLNLPFSSLPFPPTPYAIPHVGDELFWIIPDDEEKASSQESCQATDITFHEDVEALTVSAKSCVLCATVQAEVQIRIGAFNEALKKFGSTTGDIVRAGNLMPSNVRLWLTEPYDGARGFYVWARHPKRQRELVLMAAVGFSVESSTTFSFRYHLSCLVSLTVSASHLSAAFPSRPLVPDSGATESLERVSHWLKECLEHHKDCLKEPSVLPTRILDIGVDGDTIRLVDGLCKTDLYVCLSYCVRHFKFLGPSPV